jgi:hypothetical protein
VDRMGYGTVASDPPERRALTLQKTEV